MAYFLFIVLTLNLICNKVIKILNIKKCTFFCEKLDVLKHSDLSLTKQFN